MRSLANKNWIYKNNKLFDTEGVHNGDHMKYKEEILKMLDLVDEIYLRYLYKLIKEMIAKQN